jgi:Tfp pilus assembly protein PilX
MSSLVANSRNSALMRSKTLLVVVDEVHLVDAEHEVRDPSSDARNACRRDCSSMPLRASTRMSARSAVDAPVTMLRVYWMWPGVSAMMNLRLGVAK